MLGTVHSILRRTAKKAGLSDNQVEDLLRVDAEHEFSIKLQTGKEFSAYRVQHNDKLGPYKGGVRFHPQVDLDETRALATLMSLKTAAIGLPLGGAKGGVAVDPKRLSDSELEELSRAYSRHLAKHIGPDKDVPAPDVNTDSRIIDWMIDEYQITTGNPSKAAFTGKSLEKGGSAGREEATGRGGVYALAKYLELKSSSNKLTYAIQGFGNVGLHFSSVAEQEQPGWSLVAASDSKGGVYIKDGINPSKLAEFKLGGGSIDNYDTGKKITNDELLAADVDLLVLAALGDAVNGGNMRNIKAKYVLELANGPVSEEANNYLNAKGVVIIPDIIANSGGVIVSYLEWLQNKNDEQWNTVKVNSQLKKYIDEAVQNVYDLSHKESTSLKEAAFTLAIKRLLEPNGK